MERIFKMLELIGFIIVILLLRFIFRTTKFFIKMAIIIYVLFMVFKYGETFMAK